MGVRSKMTSERRFAAMRRFRHCLGVRLRHVDHFDVKSHAPASILCRSLAIVALLSASALVERFQSSNHLGCRKDGGWGRRASCWQRRPQIAFAVCWSDAAWSSSRCDIARFLWSSRSRARFRVVNCSTPAAAIRVDSACRRSGSADGKQSLPLFHIIADRGIEGDDAPRIGREYLYAFSAFGIRAGE